MRSLEVSMVRFVVVAVVLICGSTHALSAIEGASWFPIGPAPGNFTAFPGGVAGRASAIAISPADPDHVWVGTAQGGVWSSTDAGANWIPISDKEASLAIGSLAVAGCDVSGCTWIYAGTGENAIRRDTFYGKGLLVGVADEGGPVSWSLKTGTPYDFRYGSIFNVVLDPTTSGSTQRIYVTLSSGVTASATESTSTAPEPMPGGYGVYRSDDNGNTWTKLDIPGSEGFRPTDLEINPDNPQVLYAAFLGRGIFKTEDGGSTWCPLNKGIPKPMGCPGASNIPPNPNNDTFDHVEIALFPGDPDVMYASYGHCPSRLLDSCAPSIYRSANGGGQWNERFVGSASPGTGCVDSYSRYTHALAVHPTDPDTVFLGSIQLCKSSNSGASPWNFTDTNTLGSVTHFDHRAVVFHPAVTSRAYEVNDGGIAVSYDTGNTWTPRNEDLQTHGFQSVASSPNTPRVIGGLQDNAGQMWIGSREWEGLPCCGDGGFSIMDSDDLLKMYVTTNIGNNSSTFGVVPRRSSDGGASFGDSINTGLPTTEPRSFYSPFVEDPTAPHPLYFGTHRLFKSTNDASSWTAVSPVLGTTLSPTQAAEIVAGQDVISAIAVAPSNPDRIYLGYYSGKVYVTNGACTDVSCWPERSNGLPAAPITWIAVHPAQPDTAYATLGGFFSGTHVYKTTNGGVNWSATAAHASLNGVPANTIAVEAGAPDRLWLGTDIGVFKSHNGGGSWFPFNNGLSNVPVFEISIDESRGRVFAGTHGRGVYLLTRPFLANFEGWVGDSIWDIPLYGHGFLPNQNCTVKLLRQDNSVCASGNVDAIGGTIQTDGSGALVTNAGGFYNGKTVVWACLNGNCVGGQNIASCNQSGNRLAGVIAICGPQVGIDVMLGCPPFTNPPSSFVTLTGLGGFFASSESRESEGGIAATGTFQLYPTNQVGDGSTEALCGVDVPFSGGETTLQVLERARDAVNGDAVCMGKGVSAEVFEGEPQEVEDRFPTEDKLRLMAPTLTGAQLVPTVRAAPGETTNLCFSLDKLGVPVANQIRIMRVRFETAEGGAAGGAVVIRERTGLGDCKIRVPTSAGQTAGEVAQAVEDAFQAPGIPGPNPDCPSRVNPRDVNRHGDSVVAVLPSRMEICMEDAGLGFSVGPEEICFTDNDCEDGNPCTRNSCDPETRSCVTVAEPDGLSCEDNDPCTEGRTCQGGVCGAPLLCDDGIACTEDSCDSSSGQCVFTTVECDDGNPCTRDICDQQTGMCVADPQVGATCDDGNLCTVQDVCMEDQATGGLECVGMATCDDFDPCTFDSCDPITGECSSTAISCSDGNPCTTDFCEGGFCGSDPLVGVSCDDGNLCTERDTCVDVGTDAPLCEGQPVLCSDQNPCTEDICDAVTGGCLNPPVALTAVETLTFSDKTTFSWSMTPDATHWNSYRGTIPAGGMSSRAVPYDHKCFESADAAGDGARVSIDMEVPAPGTGFYYDSTGESECGESPLGTDSDGTVRPNSEPCPTPP